MSDGIPYEALSGFAIFFGWLFTIPEVGTRGTEAIVGFLLATLILFAVSVGTTSVVMNLIERIDLT